MCVLNFLLFKKISTYQVLTLKMCHEEKDHYNFTSVLFIFYSKAILFQSFEIQKREKKENK
jgi:hypothetical protein